MNWRFRRYLQFLPIGQSADPPASEEPPPRATIVPEDQAETVVHRWITMQDEKVRPAHAAAHGQTVRVDEPFIVGGERLRHPGDTGLGASHANTSDCRCVAEYGVIRDGEFVTFGVATARFEPTSTLKPTKSFTFGYGRGPWRGRVVLDNLEHARYTVRVDGISIRVNRRLIASAPVQRDVNGAWLLGTVWVSSDYNHGAITELLLNAVADTNRWIASRTAN